MQSAQDTQIADARDTMSIIRELSSELNTGLDDECLRLITALCEHGIQPEALADAILRNSKR